MKNIREYVVMERSGRFIVGVLHTWHTGSFFKKKIVTEFEKQLHTFQRFLRFKSL